MAQLTHSPDPSHLGTGAGTADVQDNEARRYADYGPNGGWDVGKATGATAGTPGTWAPPNAQVPYDLAETVGKTATPATAWTTGQYVVLGDASEAHWSGTAYVAGRAP